MNYYKDPANGIRALSDDDVARGGESLLPPGCVSITQADADAMLTPPPPTLAQAKAAQIQTITSGFESQLAQITGAYPLSELASWDSQYTEAVAWTANNATPTPLLSAIVAVNGATMSDQAASVLTKAAAFKAASGAAIGKRQKLTDQINAAPDVATVQAIVW